MERSAYFAKTKDINLAMYAAGKFSTEGYDEITLTVCTPDKRRNKGGRYRSQFPLERLIKLWTMEGMKLHQIHPPAKFQACHHRPGCLDVLPQKPNCQTQRINEKVFKGAITETVERIMYIYNNIIYNLMIHLIHAITLSLLLCALFIIIINAVSSRLLLMEDERD